MRARLGGEVALLVSERDDFECVGSESESAIKFFSKSSTISESFLADVVRADAEEERSCGRNGITVVCQRYRIHHSRRYSGSVNEIVDHGGSQH